MSLRVLPSELSDNELVLSLFYKVAISVHRTLSLALSLSLICKRIISVSLARQQSLNVLVLPCHGITSLF